MIYRFGNERKRKKRRNLQKISRGGSFWRPGEGFLAPHRPQGSEGVHRGPQRGEGVQGCAGGLTVTPPGPIFTPQGRFSCPWVPKGCGGVGVRVGLDSHAPGSFFHAPGPVCMAPGCCFCFRDNFGYETRNFEFFISIESASLILAYKMIIKG